MKQFSQILSDLHQSLLNADAGAFLDNIKVNPRVSPKEQLLIYIDAYRIRLRDAIKDDYPCLIYYAGEVKVDGWIYEFIQLNPPSSYSLDFYPARFAEYLETISSDEFANEIAELEASIIRVFQAADSEPLMPVSMMEMAPEQFASKVFIPRTALELLNFKFPANHYLTQFRAGNYPAMPGAGAAHLAICRNNNEVQRHELSASEFRLLSALCSGAPTADAIASYIASNPGCEDELANNLQGWFQRWVQGGFFQNVDFQAT